MSTRADTRWSNLRQIDALLAAWPSRAAAERPATGWVSAIRRALGMSSIQLARRLGIARSSLLKLEEREVEGGATLEILQRAANAMDCDLVYALVPRAGSLARAVEERAELVARQLAARAGQTMSLEAQTVESGESAEQQRVVARRLLAEWPRDLWDASWDSARPPSAPLTGDDRADD
jgi:predicted DNA-binding mobile mystery protein A